MLMNSFFLNKKMLIFQIIVLFSNFEYYASHPIFDKISKGFFSTEKVFLPNDRGGLFDWNYNYYKNVTGLVQNAFTKIKSKSEFTREQNTFTKEPYNHTDLFYNEGYGWDKKNYQRYVCDIYNGTMNDYELQKGEEVVNKIYPQTASLFGENREFSQNSFERYKHMPDFGIGAMAGKIASDLFTVVAPAVAVTATIALPIIFTKCPPLWRNKKINAEVKKWAESCCYIKDEMNVQKMRDRIEEEFSKNVKGQFFAKKQFLNTFMNAFIMRKYDTFDFSSTSDSKCQFIILKGPSGVGKNLTVDAIKKAVCSEGELFTIDSSMMGSSLNPDIVCDNIFRGEKYMEEGREFKIKPRLLHYLNMLKEKNKIGIILINELDKFMTPALGEKFRAAMDNGKVVVDRNIFDFTNVIVIITANWGENIRDINAQQKEDTTSSLNTMNIDVSLLNRMPEVVFENLSLEDYKEIVKEKFEQLVEQYGKNIDLYFDDKLVNQIANKLLTLNKGARPMVQFFGALRLKIIWEQSKHGILLAKPPVSDELFELKLKTQKLKRKAKEKIREERKKELALWKEISNKKILGFKFKIEYDEDVRDFNLIEEKVELPDNIEEKNLEDSTESVNSDNTENNENDSTESVNSDNTENNENDSTESVNSDNIENNENDSTESVNSDNSENNKNDSTESVNSGNTEDSIIKKILKKIIAPMKLLFFLFH